MSTPLSFCDVSARYGQPPAPQKTIEEQAGWDLSKVFMNYLLKVRRQQKQDEKEAEEEALLAVIDAMNASEKDKKAGKTDMTTARSLAKAGKAIVSRAERTEEDGTKEVAWVDPTQTLTIQVLLSCLGDRFTFEQADQIQENTDEALKQAERKIEEEQLEITEQRGPNDPSATENMERR